MPPLHRAPVGTVQHGWGWHRLKMFAPDLVGTVPENSKLAPLNTRALEMHFAKSLDLSGALGKKIGLYKVSDETKPVWEIDLDATHPSQGKRHLILDGLPPLEADTQYFVLIEPAAFKVGGRPVHVINDGAYWWRFRTESK